MCVNGEGAGADSKAPGSRQATAVTARPATHMRKRVKKSGALPSCCRQAREGQGTGGEGKPHTAQGRAAEEKVRSSVAGECSSARKRGNNIFETKTTKKAKILK